MAFDSQPTINPMRWFLTVEALYIWSDCQMSWASLLHTVRLLFSSGHRKCSNVHTCWSLSDPGRRSATYTAVETGALPDSRRMTNGKQIPYIYGLTQYLGSPETISPRIRHVFPYHQGHSSLYHFQYILAPFASVRGEDGPRQYSWPGIPLVLERHVFPAFRLHALWPLRHRKLWTAIQCQCVEISRRDYTTMHASLPFMTPQYWHCVTRWEGY